MKNEHLNESIDFKYLYDTAPCGLLTFEINGFIIYSNKTLLNWLSISDNEIKSKKFPDLLDKAGVMYYQLFVQPLLKMHQQAKEINLNIQTSADTFACLFNGVVINQKADGGQIVNAIIFKIDDRKKYEHELLLKRTKAEEEKQLKSKALQEVSFNQAHLVRAPLANILGLTSLLEQMLDNDHEIKQIVSMLQESALALDQQVRSIVDKADSS